MTEPEKNEEQHNPLKDLEVKSITDFSELKTRKRPMNLIEALRFFEEETPEGKILFERRWSREILSAEFRAEIDKLKIKYKDSLLI